MTSLRRGRAARLKPGCPGVDVDSEGLSWPEREGHAGRFSGDDGTVALGVQRYGDGRLGTENIGPVDRGTGGVYDQEPLRLASIPTDSHYATVGPEPFAIDVCAAVGQEEDVFAVHPRADISSSRNAGELGRRFPLPPQDGMARADGLMSSSTTDGTREESGGAETAGSREGSVGGFASATTGRPTASTRRARRFTSGMPDTGTASVTGPAGSGANDLTGTRG